MIDWLRGSKAEGGCRGLVGGKNPEVEPIYLKKEKLQNSGALEK